MFHLLNSDILPSYLNYNIPFSVDLFPVYNKKVTINRVILVLLMNPKQCWVSGARAGCLHSPVLPLSKLI